MLDISNSLLLMTALFNAGLSLFLIRGNNRTSSNLFFAVFLFALFLWAVALIYFQLTLSPLVAIYSAKASYISALVVGASFYLFSISFPSGMRQKKSTVAIFYGGVLAYSLALLMPMFLIRDITVNQGYKDVILGLPEYLLFAFLFCLLFVGGLMRLWFKYFQSSGAEKVQLLVIAMSVSIAGAAGIYYNLVLASPFIANFRYLWSGPVFTSFIAVTIVYSVFRLHLFNTKVIVTEFGIALLWIFTFLRTLLASETREQILNGGLFVLALVIGVLLIVSVKREVKAREEIEKLASDLARVNARLKELDQLKSEFVSIASHQLRSPLAAMKGYASLVLEGSFGKVPPAIAEAVAKIFDSSKSLTLIVEDFLNVSRIEQGRMKYDFAEVDLKDVIEKVVEELMPTVARAKLTLTFDTDRQPPYMINADVGKIKQVVTNLIDNAIKYTPHGSIAVKISKVPDGLIRVAVSDTGIGMTPETIPELFQKFTRARDANKTNVLGTGLGLYVAKEMVDAHDGRIWAESAGPGKGSTFSFELSEYEHKRQEHTINNFATDL